MTSWKQIKKSLCWYGIGLVITVPFVLSLYYAVLPRWSGAMTTVLYLSAAAFMFYRETDNCDMGVTAFIFAALPSIGHAMSENPHSERHFSLMLRLYAIGFGFVAVAWFARHAMNWIDARERRSSSK